tara:strand:- start:470 stop:1663 length:1194 start_codon:yes stop_codon:yes gene_type:complete
MKPEPFFIPSLKLIDEYPEIFCQKNSLSQHFQEQWEWIQKFLDYIHRTKGQGTYSVYSIEMERWFNYLVMVKDKSLCDIDDEDILDYIDFCCKPDSDWINDHNCARYKKKNAVNVRNPNWRPFKVRKNNELSKQTLNSIFSALSSLYKYINKKGWNRTYPVDSARAECKRLSKGNAYKVADRLSRDEWLTILKTAINLADQDPKYETNLFVVVTLKVFGMRIHELSRTEFHTPVMGDFSWAYDSQTGMKQLILNIFGKGNKIRQVSVPDAYLDYLIRYRRYLGNLTDLPLPNEKTPLVRNSRGKAHAVKQLSRIVGFIFAKSTEQRRIEKGPDEAKRLERATTHIFRHTFATELFEADASLFDVSVALGHASMATTNKIYLHNDSAERFRRESKRKI